MSLCLKIIGGVVERPVKAPILDVDNSIESLTAKPDWKRDFSALNYGVESHKVDAKYDQWVTKLNNGASVAKPTHIGSRAQKRAARALRIQLPPNTARASDVRLDPDRHNEYESTALYLYDGDNFIALRSPDSFEQATQTLVPRDRSNKCESCGESSILRRNRCCYLSRKAKMQQTLRESDPTRPAAIRVTPPTGHCRVLQAFSEGSGPTVYEEERRMVQEGTTKRESAEAGAQTSITEEVKPEKSEHDAGERDVTNEHTLNTKWHLGEIPAELRIHEENTPPLLRVIIDEFWRGCQAIQASARNLQTQQCRTSPHEPPAHLKSGDRGGPSMSSPGSPSLPGPQVDAANSGYDFSVQSRNSKNPSAQTLFGLELKPESVRISNVDKGKKPCRSGIVAHLSLTKECASCFDEVLSGLLIDLSCKHSYCRSCFVRLVVSATSDEHSWPPRCCLINIPRSMILRHLSHKQLIEFSAKEKEYNTPTNRRWYCTNTKCLQFFQASNKNCDWAQCPHCKHQMCIFCRGPRHERTVRCPQDKGLQALLAEAQRQHWQSCPRCHSIIQISEGCRHMTCRCGANFCYVCGSEYSRCRCTDDDHRRLLRAAQGRIAQERNAQVRVEERRHARAEEGWRLRITREEEAAIQAAIEASAEQERQEIEQQLLEERRQAQQIEEQRLTGIRDYYGKLRNQLLDVHTIQVKRAETRRAETITDLESQISSIKNRQQELEKGSAIEDKPTSFRSFKTAATSRLTSEQSSVSNPAIASIRQQWDREIIQDAQRYSQYLVQYLEDTKSIEESERAFEISGIIAMQERRHRGRDERFQRKIEELEDEERAKNSVEAISKMNKGFEAQLAELAQALETTRLGFKAEDKWIEYAREERVNLLAQDEERFTRSGADASAREESAAVEAARIDQENAATADSREQEAAQAHPASLELRRPGTPPTIVVAESSAMAAKRGECRKSPLEAYFAPKAGRRDRRFTFRWP